MGESRCERCGARSLRARCTGRGPDARAPHRAELPAGVLAAAVALLARGHSLDAAHDAAMMVLRRQPAHGETTAAIEQAPRTGGQPACARTASDLDLALGVLAGLDVAEAAGCQLMLPRPQCATIAQCRARCDAALCGPKRCRCFAVFHGWCRQETACAEQLVDMLQCNALIAPGKRSEQPRTGSPGYSWGHAPSSSMLCGARIDASMLGSALPARSGRHHDRRHWLSAKFSMALARLGRGF